MYVRVISLLLLVASAVPAESAGQTARDHPEGAATLSEGYAGVYPDILRGRITASGVVYDPSEAIASHRYLPLGSEVRVISEETGRSVAVRIVDRGPFADGRVMDLSESAARSIGLRTDDETYVRIVHAVRRSDPSAGQDGGGSLPPGTGFTIQLGSYSSEAAALAVRGRAEGAWVQSVRVDGQTFYRLNFGRYTSRDEAAKDLEWLESHGFFGFVKAITDGV